MYITMVRTNPDDSESQRPGASLDNALILRNDRKYRRDILLKLDSFGYISVADSMDLSSIILT